MNGALRQIIDQIFITDIKNGITEKNKNYFCFAPELPKCLHSKKILLQLSLMIGCFISTFFINDNESIYIYMNFLIAFICIWYLYDARYIYYYKKAAKLFMFNKNQKGQKYLNKIITSRRIYIEGMPVAYNILKAKQMLINNDYKAGEYLAKNALKDMNDCPEAKIIKGICEYKKGNEKKAVAILSGVSETNLCSLLKKSTEELINEITKGNDKEL